jgi:hypothetical protein
MDENENDTSGGDTEVATNVTTRTDKTHYTIPEDGRPITISTQKTTGRRDDGPGRHRRQKSQTSLLIEYFEASKVGDKTRSKPSVRVKVTPSAGKKNRSGNDSVQITSIGSDRKPSYTRRIPLPSKTAAPIEGTDLSHSSGSNLSGHSPVEIEVLNDSDLSRPGNRSSRGLSYATVESNVSSMPPDSMLEGDGERGGAYRTYEGDGYENHTTYLRAPQRTGSRSRSASQDRIAQRVMEKLGASSKPRKSSKGNDYDAQSRDRRRRSSRTHRSEDDAISGADSALSSKMGPSELSSRSGTSQASRMTNNPKLLEMVEDTIKRMILPEINAIKEDQKTDRNTRNFEDNRRGSTSSLEHRVSKSSSTPHFHSKPKVVLNRDGDDPGVVLSRGDSERIKSRRSSREYSDRPGSRRSSGRHSREGSYDEEKDRPKSSRSTHGLRGAAAAGLAAGVAGGVLTTSALRHHDSTDEISARRKRRTKSRGSHGRSESMSESIDENYRKEVIPPMPLASAVNDSDVTRESILSQHTELPPSSQASDVRTPVRQVSRGSVGDAMSPSSPRTPTGPTSRNLGMSHTNLPFQSPLIESPRLESPMSMASTSKSAGMTNRDRLAALAAAGLGGAAAGKGTSDRNVDADGYRKISTASPVQSVSSLRKTFEDDPLIPQGLRPRSAASRSSLSRLREGQTSQTSMRSESSPTTQKLAQSAKQSRDASFHDDDVPDLPSPAFRREDTGTPGAETADEWLERQHLINDHYRDSTEMKRDSYQTNPYPEDAKRFTLTTDDSYLDRHTDDGADVRGTPAGGLNPNYMHTPMVVESAVASLMDPSTVSSHIRSSTSSAAKSNGTYSDRMAAHLREMAQDKPRPLYEGSTTSGNMPSRDRWAAIKGHARELSDAQSPAQSPARDHNSVGDEPRMGVSGIPLAEDPLPEIGHYDSQSDLTTNPSIIQGPLGGDASGKSTWPYTPEPHQVHAQGGANNVAGGAAALAAAHAKSERNGKAHAGIDREATPTGSPAAFRDEGYVTDGHTRSGGGVTPNANYGKEDLADYHRAMDAQDLRDEDSFTADQKHLRHVSGDSHGMESPLYDASTGKGIERIQSKDVVALMDHLTVRDAQRNARDTEILVTLVRSAAEMRQSFDEIKQFIVEQDKLIMQNTHRDAELTAQKVLSGPRPPTMNSPRNIHRAGDSEEEIQNKRKGVLKRALKGLTGGKSSKDLARIEDMLMQILDNVEDLKHNNAALPLQRSHTLDTFESLDYSREKMRTAQDSGYEPEGQAGTSSTPSQSGHFAVPIREKQQFHSGYDGRRGSDNRVSTVAEEDDDELAPHEAHILNHQFENNERLLTPTQEMQRNLDTTPRDTPPQPTQGTSNDQTPEKQRKHKSNTSSLFGITVPKISRWSRTTASSGAPDPSSLDSPKNTRDFRPSSELSRSRSTLDDYDDDDRYSLESNDRLQSSQSLAREQDRRAPRTDERSLHSRASSKLTRTPSPLIPSEASATPRHEHGAASPMQEDNEAYFDDPKYQAHRNSLPLQHPQPRQGSTSRHQNTLESRAHAFDDPTGTNSDLSQTTVSDFDPAGWGSSGTAGLARHRLTQAEPLSPVSLNSHNRYDGAQKGDQDLLVSQQKSAGPPKVRHDDRDEDDGDWEPQYSNSGFSKSGYYSSPYGSGHLLEPIEEVRYSLETDSGRVRHQNPIQSPAYPADPFHLAISSLPS